MKKTTKTRKGLISVLFLIFMFAPASIAFATVTVELEYFWAGKSEINALNVIKEEFTNKHGSWIDSPCEDSEVLKADIIDRMAEGIPPTAFQWLGQLDLIRFTEMGLIRDISKEFKKSTQGNVLPKFVSGIISREGKIYGVPIGIHCNNTVIYNAKIYKELNLQLPKTWEEVVDHVKIIQEAGYVPIAIGGVSWEVDMLFTSILLSKLSEEQIYKLFTLDNNDVLASAEFLSAITILDQLRMFGSKDTALWSDATYLVATDKAAMQFNGNWIWGEMNALGKQIGKDYFAELTPDTELTILGLDSFLIPNVMSDEEIMGQDKLIDVMLNPEIQRSFSRHKGSFPPVFSPTELFSDAEIQIRDNLMNNRNIIVHAKLASTPDYAYTYQSALGNFWKNHAVTVDDFIKELSADIDLLDGKSN